MVYHTIIYVNIGACTTAAAPAPAAPSRFFPSLTHLISPSFLQLQQRLRPFLETSGHVDSEYTLKIDFWLLEGVQKTIFKT